MTLEKQKAETLARKLLDNPEEGCWGPGWNKRFTLDVELMAHSNWIDRNGMERGGESKVFLSFKKIVVRWWTGKW